MKTAVLETTFAAQHLHRYLLEFHVRSGKLLGPDPGIRWNYRIGRFVKSWLPNRNWKDDLYYLQAQGYWTIGNWQLHQINGEQVYRDIAIACSNATLEEQREDGAWSYPNPEWPGRVATVEGIWACLGLLETYRHTSDQKYLEGVFRWHQFMMNEIGFQDHGEESAIYYFAGEDGPRVPNNSADALRYFSSLANVTGETKQLARCSSLRAFMENSQMASGEFPYTVEGLTTGRRRPHFQCFQYNAFQCLGLMQYLENTGDNRIVPLIRNVLQFLATGVNAQGAVHYECGNRHRFVLYHTAVTAAALVSAGQLGIADYSALAERCYRYVLDRQKNDGGFRYSQGDYRLLSDGRAYPRYLAMILVHLLQNDPIAKTANSQQVAVTP